ncbi:MAG: hypothetical protein R3F46_13215 [bacterium]
MRRFVSILSLLCILAWGSAARAAEQIDLRCIKMPRCCTFTCVMIDAECCGCYGASGALMAEFLDRQGNVLGTATFNGNWCRCETTAQLDTPVDANDVCSIRLVKEDDNVMVTWASLRVFCDDSCRCGKWYKVFKGELWCWDSVPEPVMEEPRAEVPVPVKKTPPPAVAKKPEPRHDFSYFPPQQPEPEDTEVLIVIGNG